MLETGAAGAEFVELDDGRFPDAQLHAGGEGFRGQAGDDELFAERAGSSLQAFLGQLGDELGAHDVELPAAGSAFFVADDALPRRQDRSLHRNPGVPIRRLALHVRGLVNDADDVRHQDSLLDRA